MSTVDKAAIIDSSVQKVSHFADCQHEMYSEVVEAYVVRRNGHVTESDVIAFCQQRISPFKVPSKVYFVDSVDKTSLGKTKYQ